MWLLPFKLSKDNRKRLKQLVLVIREKNPDIVALQEVWNKKYIKFLSKKLSEYNFNFLAKKSFNISGLVTMSKYSPQIEKFLPFTRNMGQPFFEKSVRKGLLKVEYKINGKKIAFYNTHLSCPNGGNEKYYTMKQFEFIKNKINQKQVSILCGDLNLKDREFERINNNFFSYAENSKNTFSIENKYLRKWWDRKPEANKKIDYILIKVPEKIKFNFNSETIKHALSDHFGIYSEIELK
jgi:endonuclease/exonuclease/phosphatase family metal-dependent hydrolase